MADDDETFRINAVLQLVKAAEALLDLANSAQSLIRSYNALERRAAVGNSWDLSRLSDGILARIFHYLGETDFTNAPGIALSHVNHRFRALVLDTPSLWKCVSATQSQEELHVCLERSRDAGLHVDLIFDHHWRSMQLSDHDTEQFLTAIIPHAHRWDAVTFETDGSCTSETYGTLQKMCHNLELPSLRLLEIIGIGPEPKDSKPMSQNDYEEMHFYASWNMPNLKTLFAEDFMPHEYMDEGRAIGPQLTSCIFHVYTEHLYEMDALYEFLRARPSIRNLDLTFKTALCMDLDDTFKELLLPDLKSFSVDLSGSATCARSDINVFRDFMHSLRTPKLTELEISISDCQEEDVPKWLSGLLPPENDCPQLESFSLSVRIEEESFKPDPYDAVWARLPPTLRHLSIEVPDSALRLTLDQPKLAQLRTLRLQNCHLTDGEQVDGLLYRMTRAGGWPQFEKLIISECPLIEPHRGCVAHYLPKATIE